MNLEAIENLRECRTEDDVESVFKKYGIKGIQNKREYLHVAGYSPERRYFKCLDNPKVTECELYDLDLEVFLTRDWELNEVYIRAGL